MRYRNRIKIAKGLHLNLSKSGIGASFQVLPGLSFSVNKNGVYRNTSIPGTGFYDRERISSRCQDVANDQTLYDVTYEIDDDGKLSLRVALNGVPVEDEAVIRRLKKLDQVKNMAQELILESQKEIDDKDDAFINIHKHAEHPVKEQTIKTKLAKLTCDEVLPEPYDIAEPTREDIITILTKEAKTVVSSLFFWTLKRKRQDYVDRNADNRLQSAKSEWLENKNSYEKEELARVKAINDGKMQDYLQAKKTYETYLWGDEDQVCEQIDRDLSSLSFPANFSVSYSMDLDNNIIKLDVDLPEIEDLPNKKATVLASGQLSIKDKSKKALFDDYATCVCGLAFFLAGMIFNTSSKINLIEVSGFSQRLNPKTGNVEDEYLYSVLFDRETVSGLSLHHIVPQEAFSLFPHHMEIDSKGRFRVIQKLSDVAVI